MGSGFRVKLAAIPFPSDRVSTTLPSGRSEKNKLPDPSLQISVNRGAKIAASARSAGRLRMRSPCPLEKNTTGRRTSERSSREEPRGGELGCGRDIAQGVRIHLDDQTSTDRTPEEEIHPRDADRTEIPLDAGSRDTGIDDAEDSRVELALPQQPETAQRRAL